MKHQGFAPFAQSGYKVFRNVKTDFNAVGDGIADDTAAINAAIAAQGRCDPAAGCKSTTTTPAIVYLPPGTYRITGPIFDFYYTQIIGHPDCMPTLLVDSSWSSANGFVLDGDHNEGFGSTNIFWRQIRNIRIDMTAIPPSFKVSGIHWNTGQATSIQNVEISMSTAPGNLHQGLFVEDGSAGFVTDITFNGGNIGAAVGNQQFTMRNLTFQNCNTAVSLGFDWSWTFQGINIHNCQLGFDVSVGAPSSLGVEGMIIIDSSVTNTPVFVKSGRISDNPNPTAGDSVILENIQVSNVTQAVAGPSGQTLFAGPGTGTIAAWGSGKEYSPQNVNGSLLPGEFTPNARPANLITGPYGNYYVQSKPQFSNIPASKFVSVRDGGAKGDGVTDDTAAIQSVILAAATNGNYVFFDYGLYLVSSTIYVPAGSKIIGESYSVILASSAADGFFNDETNPRPVVQLGASGGETGQIEWTDMIVSTQGQNKGAILIQWNIESSPLNPSGMWDVHTRVGGFMGSQLQATECPISQTAADLITACMAAFMEMWITSTASGIYFENVWLWVADHDADNPNLTQNTIYSGRGLLIESSGPLWLYGTAVEHNQLYQYQLVGASEIVMGFIQTETAYYQPSPDASAPFVPNSLFKDPSFTASNPQDGWGARFVDSEKIFVYGAGFYSFFVHWDSTTCPGQGDCQSVILDIESSNVTIYGLATVGTVDMVMDNGQAIIPASQNSGGFPDVFAVWAPTSR